MDSNCSSLLRRVSWFFINCLVHLSYRLHHKDSIKNFITSATINDFEIWAGITKLDDKNKIVLKADSIKVHELFFNNQKIIINDIGLIHLSKPLPFLQNPMHGKVNLMPMDQHSPRYSRDVESAILTAWSDNAVIKNRSFFTLS